MPKHDLDAAVDESRSRSRRVWIGAVVALLSVVVLAVALGAFVLGIGHGLSSAPQAAWEAEYDETTRTLTVTHDGGDAVLAAEIDVVVEGESTEAWWTVNERITAGDRITVEDVAPGDSVAIRWNPEDSDESSVIYRHEVPERDATVA